MIIFLLSSFAWADAINIPENPNCPPGSSLHTSHAGTWCQATTCTDDSECSNGLSCIGVSLCVESSEVPCGGMVPDSGACTVEKDEALGTCESQSDCSSGECETAMRCADPEALENSKEDEADSGCSVIQQSTTAGVLLSVLTLMAFGRREEQD